MITGVYGSTITAYLTLEEKRINTTVAKSAIRYLFKFTNDMTKDVKYSYAESLVHNDRYVKCTFLHNTTDNLYEYKINFKPYGFWKYEVYEVTWVGTVTVAKNFAPSTESEVLSPAADNKGVVQGLVTKGKMYLAEKSGTEQVQFTEYTPTATDNYIYYGQ